MSKLCVWTVVCEQVVCGQLVCEQGVCGDHEEEADGGRRAEKDWSAEPKKEPHTKMWGKMKNPKS